MKIKNLFYPLSLAMAAMTLTACSSTESEEAVTAETAKAGQTGTFQVSINVGPAETRAISVGGNNGQTLYTNWDQNDAVQVVKDGTSVGTLTADVSAGNTAYATLTGTLSGTFAVNDQVTLYYHSANIDYTGQKGTLPDVSTNKSFLTATSTVQQINQVTGTISDNGGYLVMSNASYSPMQAYLDISFTDTGGNPLAITQLDIWTSGGKLVKTAPLGGEKTYATEASPLTITPDAATDHFFLALRDEAGASNTIYFKATTATDTYIYSQDSNLEIGRYYYAASPKAMTDAAYLAATPSDIGKVIGRNGKIYDTTDAATTDGTTACAIIAYVGSETGESAPYNHGLAIAMKDANNAYSTKWMWNDSEPHYSAVNPNQYTDIAVALAAKESGSSLSSGKNTGTYPAFQAALANSIETETGISAAAPATGTSGWFMPSIFQWNQIVNGLTGTTTPFTTSTNSSLSYTAVNPKIEAAGGVGLKAHFYWSSTEYDSDIAWCYYATHGRVYADSNTNKKSLSNYIRAAFAF